MRTGAGGPLPLWKTILFYALSLTLPLALMEVCARVLVDPPAHPLQKKHAHLIEILGLTALNEVMTPDPDLFWKLKPNINHFKVAGTIDGQPIDFSLSTDEEGLRGSSRTPAGRAERILVLGDSCAFGVGVTDDQTWPAQLERILNQAGDRQVEVRNAGVPGYTAYQGRIFLEKRGLAMRPDLVIAAFGFNDASSWGSRSDVDIAAGLRVRAWDASMMRSRLYVGMKELAAVLRPPGDTGGEKTHARVPPQTFYRTLRDMNAACSRNGIPMMLVVWPYAAQVEDKDPTRVRFQAIVDRAGSDAGMPTISLIEPFIEAGAPLFLDHIHANPAGCRAAAERIAAAVRPILSHRQGSEGGPPAREN